MGREFQYPLLFKPEETIVGPFDNKHPDYLLLYQEINGGHAFTVIQLEKGKGRREIAVIRSMSYEGGRTNAYRKYQDDLIQRGLWEDQ